MKNTKAFVVCLKKNDEPSHVAAWFEDKKVESGAGMAVYFKKEAAQEDAKRRNGNVSLLGLLAGIFNTYENEMGFEVVEVDITPAVTAAPKVAKKKAAKKVAKK